MPLREKSFAKRPSSDVVNDLFYHLLKIIYWVAFRAHAVCESRNRRVDSLAGVDT